jgi:hypothetical protein
MNILKIAKYLKAVTLEKAKPAKYYQKLVQDALYLKDNKNATDKQLETMYIRVRDALFEINKNGVDTSGTGLYNQGYIIKNLEFVKGKLYDRM